MSRKVLPAEQHIAQMESDAAEFKATLAPRVMTRAELREQELSVKVSLDYSLIADVEVDGVNTRDYPDFCDAFIASATYDGREMTEEELEVLNEDGAYVYERVIERLF